MSFPLLFNELIKHVDINIKSITRFLQIHVSSKQI